MRYVLEGLLLAAAATGGWLLASPGAVAPAPPGALAHTAPKIVTPAATMAGAAAESGARAFGFCHSGGGTDCVVDGDTFWMDGAKIRVADIDAPETHPSRCPEEARLGQAATRRLQALLSAGPVTLETGDRDTDKYGRALRIVTRGGKSLGEQLVREGLARRWTGRRQPWCGAA